MKNNNKIQNNKENKTVEELACLKKIHIYKNTNLNDSAYKILTNDNELTHYLRIHYYINPSKNKYDAKFHEEKLKSKVYENMSFDSIDNSMKYIFNKMKTGIFVRIFNNQLTHFVPIYNKHFINDYSEYIKFEQGDVKRYLDHKRTSHKYIQKVNYDVSKWNAVNCLLRNEYDDNDVSISGFHEFYNMITNTCRHRKVNDCIFFINRKDFPYLKNDYTESYNHIFGSENHKLKSPYDKYTYAPILSQSSSNKHADLLIPTEDDWDLITQELYIKSVDSCKNSYKFPDNFIFPEWKDRKNIVFWRGNGTGCGSTIMTNPRLKLSHLSQELKKQGKTYLDAGIVNLTKRDKKLEGEKFVTFEKKQDNIQFAQYMDKFEQVKHKYTINVEGNSAAYRFGSLFKMGYCILNVDCKYKLWFEQFIEPYVHYVPVKNDLSDLVEKIEWCLNNDNKCEQIAINGKKIYEKYFNKDFIYDYLADMFNGISAKFKDYKYKQNVPVDLVSKFYHSTRLFKLNFELIKKTDKLINNHDVLIIVPFRDNKEQNRKQQLDIFLEYYKNYDILIVEQSDDNRKFNRGALLNIGVNYIRKEKPNQYKSYIFHDVDILLEYDIIDRYYMGVNDGILHIGNLTPKYSKIYNDFLGAILKVDNESFFRFNGYPNTFWGWGSEDDACALRIYKNNLKVKRPDETGIHGKELDHIDTNKLKHLVQENRYENIIFDEQFWPMNGIKQCTFNLNNKKNMSKYIDIITVEIL